MFRLEDLIRGAWHDRRGMCGGYSKDLDIENGCRVRAGGEPPGREVLAARAMPCPLSSADSPFCRTWKPWQRKAWSKLREQSAAVTQFSRKIADHPTSL